MDIPKPRPYRQQLEDDEDTLSPLATPPLAQRRRQESANSTSLDQSQTARKISWHSSTSRGPSPGADRPAEDSITRIQEESDETTAILPFSKSDNRNYNTQNDTSTRSQDMDGANDRQADPTNKSEDSLDTEKLPWWKRQVEKFGSVELENKGSVARDHLALERTFLAWLRTSLSFASIGIAVTQLFRLNTSINHQDPTDNQLRLRHVGKPLGATFIAIGVATLLVGFHRYFESQHYVIRGKFPASRGSVLLVSLLSASLIIASFAVILSVAPQTL